MELPNLRLWEAAALRPSSADPSPRPPRRRPDPLAEASADDLTRARLVRARIRAATLHGLSLSLFLSAPLGWSVAASTVFAKDPSAAEECPKLASFLPATLQRQLKAGRQALSSSEESTLAIRVCDPAMRVVLGPLLGGVSDLGELRDLAKSATTGPGVKPLPAIQSFLTQPLGD